MNPQPTSSTSYKPATQPKSTDVKMVTIGSLNVALPAFITLVAGTILAIIIVFIAPNVFGVMFAIYLLLVVMLVSISTVHCSGTAKHGRGSSLLCTFLASYLR